MKRLLMTAAASLALAACGEANGNDNAGQAADMGNAVDNATAPESNATANEAAPVLTASSGQQYVELAGGSDLYEIESARLALEKTQNADIRALAQMILTDHERSTRELTAAAGRAQPPIPVAPSMTAEQQANVQALRAAAAETFDREYLQQQIRAHEQALGLVTHYSANGDVEPLRGHASTVADPIRQHLNRARELVVTVS
jgi:putative membrane protein